MPPATTTAPLDAYLADADATERHAVVIAAPPAAVRAALWQADLGGPLARALLALRVLPAALLGGRAARRRLAELARRRALTLHDLTRAGFAPLADTPDLVVLGLTGRFWTLGGGIVPTDPATWAAGPPRGRAQAAWSFELAAHGTAGTRLTTETRVRCADAATRRVFRRYWFVVQPASGLLRRLTLGRVRRAAERAAARSVARS